MQKLQREKELTKLSGGKNTFKSLLMSNKSKVNRITELTRKIQDVSLDIDDGMCRVRDNLSVSMCILK